jgi:hypothetical protein
VGGHLNPHPSCGDGLPVRFTSTIISRYTLRIS